MKLEIIRPLLCLACEGINCANCVDGDCSSNKDYINEEALEYARKTMICETCNKLKLYRKEKLSNNEYKNIFVCRKLSTETDAPYYYLEILYPEFFGCAFWQSKEKEKLISK